MKEFGVGVYGQQKSIRTIKNIISSRRIPHALLFNGGSGVGKHLLAVEFAKYLYKYYFPDTTDTISQKIHTLSEPYIKFIIPLPRGKNETADDSPLDKLDAEQMKELNNEISQKVKNPYHKIYLSNANNIKINSIRDIRKFISINFGEIPWRFILISEAHLMTEEAQNALLKSLEEPPEGIVFILLTPSKEKLLPTILSRCWHVDFEPLDHENTVRVLMEYFNVDENTASRVSYFAGGSVHVALDLIENDFDLLIEKTIALLRFSLVKWYDSALKELAGIMKNYPAEIFIQILKMIIMWFADTVKNKNEIADYYFGHQIDTIKKFNEKFKNTDLSYIFGTVEKLITAVDRNVNLNIISTNIIFELGTISVR